MSLITSTNYTAAGTTFDYATAGSDPIFKEHIQLLAKAFHDHTHESTRGLPVRRIDTASAPGSSGQVQISGDTLRWWGTTSSAIFSAASLTGTETFSNKTLITPTIASFANANHNHSNSAAGGGIDGSAVTTTVTGTGNVVKATSPTIATPTITSPSIAGGTLSGVFSGGTFTTATMTSPALNSPTITTATFSGTQTGGTFSGATLTTPTIASFTNAQHDHSSASQGGLVSASAPVGQTLTNPKINDLSSTNTYNFATSELTADRTVTLPLLTSNDVFVFADFIQTLQNKTLISPTIGSFTNAQHNHTVASAGGTLDGGAIGTSVTGTGNVVKATSPSITSPTISGATFTGSQSGGTFTGTTLTTPTINGATLTGTIAGGTHTGATLTAPTIATITNGGTLTLPTGTDTLVGRATTDTLTNKTLSSPTLSGSISGTPSWTSAQNITVGTAAQPNITSLGNLSGLTIASGQLAIPVGSAVSPALVFDAGCGLFSLGNDRLNFATQGSVRAEIDTLGNMGLGATPAAWHSTRRAFQVGQTAALRGDPGAAVTELTDNTYLDASSVERSLATSAGLKLVMSSGTFGFWTAPSVSAGSGQTFTGRLNLDDSNASFRVNIIPSTTLAYNLGNASAVWGNVYSNNLISAPSNHLGLYANNAAGGSSFFVLAGSNLAPATDNTYSLGIASTNRWTNVYAVSGTGISLRSYKNVVAPLDPERALATVLGTKLWQFTYKTDPEKLLRSGFMADETDHLLALNGEQYDPQSTAAVALAAIQALAAKIAALEARMH